LLPQAVLALTQCVDPTLYCRHTLTDGQVEPFDKGGIDLPATWRKHLRDAIHGAEHHAVGDPHDAFASGRFHHLRIRVAGKIVRFYTLRAQLLSRDGDLVPLSCDLFAPLCRKYAALAARVVVKRLERC
jgi:hypothetical protein